MSWLYPTLNQLSLQRAKLGRYLAVCAKPYFNAVFTSYFAQIGLGNPHSLRVRLVKICYASPITTGFEKFALIAQPADQDVERAYCCDHGHLSVWQF
jgi:hypothetical protein